MATWFTYEYCTDIAATRRFYGALIGLTQTWDEPDDVAFKHGTVQLSFQRVDTLDRPGGWAFQPGWSNGQLADAPPVSSVRSISIALSPAAFAAAIGRLQVADVEQLRTQPFWVGYWSFVVKDPDGLTVELTDPRSPEHS